MKLLRFYPLLIIIVISVLMRFLFLDKIPGAVTGDELHYAIVAKTHIPWSVFVFRYPPGEGQAELPYFLHLVDSRIPFSMFLFKLPFALLGVGSVILLYAIALHLFGSTIGIATGLVAAVNPWLVVMDRTGYETAPTTFFFLLGLYIMLRTRSWKILWSAVPLLFAFYSYIATKVIFIPFVILSSTLAYVVQKRRFGKQYIIISAFSVVFVLVFLVLYRLNASTERFGDLFLPNNADVISRVNEIRKVSVQSPFLPFISNKITVYTQALMAKLFHILSPEYLFIKGDQFFLPVQHGFFYAIDALFMFLGAVYLFVKKKFNGFLILLFILIGTVPQLVHSTKGDFSSHLTLMFPFLILLVGIGLSQAGRARILFAVIYGLSIVAFINVYFFQYPLTGDNDFPVRILSKYLEVSKNDATVVYTVSPDDIKSKYIYYSGNKPDPDSRVQFLDCGKFLGTATKTHKIYDLRCGGKIEGDRLTIASLIDGGEMYTIHGDNVCAKYSLKNYPSRITLTKFGIEQLSTKDFCETYISVR